MIENSLVPIENYLRRFKGTIPRTLSKSMFTGKKLFKISELESNQDTVDVFVVNKKKSRRRGYTMPYVLIYGEHKVLMDGNHTVSAKKLNGQKSVFAKFYIYEETSENI